ncbi:unnamed protein product [Wickerhamomyces anomalus]
MQLLRRNRRNSSNSRQNTNSRTATSNAEQQSSTPRSTLNSPIPPEMLRSLSEETLITSGHSIPTTPTHPFSSIPNHIRRTISNDSNLTYISRAETFVDLVLGHSFAEFNAIRTMPVVSALFQKGLYVFPSEESLNLFKTPPINCLNVSPEATIENPKIEFCRVYFKYLKDKIAKYTFQFMPNGDPNDAENETLTMYVSSVTPYADVCYKNTRLRWVGTTSMSSTFGSGFFKLLKLSDESPSLTDHLDENFPDPTNPLLASRDALANTSPLPPLARFSDKQSSSIPKKRLLRHGDIKLIEVFNSGNKDSILDIPYCSLVISSLALVLRDQEIKKYHGNARYYDTSLATTNVFY